MAKLKRAVSDGHYYILAGQHFGTWQVSEQGVRELERHRIPLPRAGTEGVDLDGVWWRYLLEQKLICTLGIPYDHHDRLVADGENNNAGSLPLLLRLQRGEPPSWSLAIELTVIPDEVLAEARERRAFYLSANDALAARTLVSQLQRAAYPARVAPQAAPYILTWYDSASHQLALRAQCFASGLRGTAQGNVFAEGQDQRWRRCFPGSAVAFWGTFYWLARAEHDPQWAGEAQRCGAIQDGWQLWRLTTNESQPVSLALISDWLRARGLTLSRHMQRLSLVTPPQAITADGWALVSGNQPLIIGCAPPERITPGVRSRLPLTVVRVNSDPSTPAGAMPTGGWGELTQALAPGEPLFARWSHPQLGDYRIQITGDATAEPLLVRVLSGVAAHLAMPTWLQGLECCLVTPDHSETLSAFARSQPMTASPVSACESVGAQVTAFSASALGQLEWKIKPLGFPIRVRWRADTSDVVRFATREFMVTSGEEMTRRWRDDVWPACAVARGAWVSLDGDSFGYIECVIGPPTHSAAERIRVLTSTQRAELAWLARCSLVPSTRVRTPIPGRVRRALEGLLATAPGSAGASTTVAVELLRARRDVPAWIVPRLRALFLARTPYGLQNSRDGW